MFDSIKVDLGKQYVVAGIFTQGNGVNNYWVMSYFVLTSMDGKNFEFIRRGDGSALVIITLGFHMHFTQPHIIPTLIVSLLLLWTSYFRYY